MSKLKQGRPNKYKNGSEFYSTKIPIGMKAEADQAIEKKFAKYQTDQYKNFKAKKSVTPNILKDEATNNPSAN